MKRRTALTTLLGSTLIASPIPVRADASNPALPRDRVAAIIRNNQRIVAPNGVEELRTIPVNGIEQWISIRGSDRKNPLLLFIHGGPGSPTMPAAWTFQRPWEDFFTVVQWDQRGAGKTYATNGAPPASTMNLNQFVDDAQTVIAYLLERFGQRKLFVLGHSWGSSVGLELARRRPEVMHAYIGCGQMIYSSRSEHDGFEFALAAARADRNAAAVRELEALAPYPGPLGTLTVERISAQRKWLMYYGGLTFGRKDFTYDADTWQLSPEYNERDVVMTDRGSLFSLTHLLGAVERTNFNALTELHVPTIMMIGRHDYATSHRVTAEWFSMLRAPKKSAVWYENSAHMMMIEEPGRFVHHLVSGVLPLANA